MKFEIVCLIATAFAAAVPPAKKSDFPGDRFCYPGEVCTTMECCTEAFKKECFPTIDCFEQQIYLPMKWPETPKPKA